MSILNIKELKKKCKDPNFMKKLMDIYSLSFLFRRCLFTSKFNVPCNLENVITLTSEGKKISEKILDEFKEITISETKLALFIQFFRKKLLIDIQKSNYLEIFNILHNLILSNKIKYPWVYDTTLYDRYFDLFQYGKNILNHKETNKLLEKTYVGVFQINDVILGPFGLLKSNESRFLPPINNVPLWHCEDPSCPAIHHVTLSGSENNVDKILGRIQKNMPEPEQLSELGSIFLSNIYPAEKTFDIHYSELPLFLANTFSESEFIKILKYILEKYSKEIRRKIPKDKKFEELFSKSANEIAKSLNKAQCLQLILLITDEEIVDSIEYLVEEKIIIIPPTELRRTELKLSLMNFGNFRPECQLSIYGLRSMPTEYTDVSILRLKSLIKEVYNKKEFEQLEWKLRSQIGLNIYQKLDYYLESESPKEILQNLIMDKKEHLEKTFKIIGYGHFILPTSAVEEKYTINKILWKLGFNIGSYPEYQDLFWKRLELFIEKAKTNISYNETDKENIRSAGANFFVSLEEVLDYSLSYTTWALLSDHYGVTKFKFNLGDARKFMVSCLNGKNISSKEKLKLDASGKNTLYPLIKGFNILADLCEKIIKPKSTKYKRNKKEFPAYHFYPKIALFPFNHKCMILDVIKEEREIIIGHLREISKILEVEQVCSIRNRIEHKRADFPKQDEIEKMYYAIDEVIKRMEKTGICPSVYLKRGIIIDEFNRSIVDMVDYKGNKIKIKAPSHYNVDIISPETNKQIIFPSIHIANSLEMLRFIFEEKSDFVNMWKGYPKRKELYV